MLKKVNKILSNSKEKKERKKEELKNKKSNDKVNQETQTDKLNKNVDKKLDFTNLIDTDKSKMNESNKNSNDLNNENIQFIEGESGDESDEKRVEEPFPKTVKILESENGSKVYLIGTAHFSEESCKDVEYVINRVKPDVVVLEICSERINTLVLDEKLLMQRIMNFTMKEANHIIKQYGLLQGIIQILFLYVSKEITKQTGMLPGSEIRTALSESHKIGNCLCHLGDRPLSITFKRAIGSLTFYQKIKLALSILLNNPKMTKEEIEEYKQNDILETYLNQLADEYPLMKRALVDERDMYLAYSLQMAATIVPRGENAIHLQRLKESRNSLASVEQQLINCKHELDNFKKIKSKSNKTNSLDHESSNNHDTQIEKYEKHLDNLKEQYRTIHEQVILDTQKIASFNQQLNSEVNYGPSKVVGIVGMGHLPGIQKHFNKVTEEDIMPILEIPQPSLQEIFVRKFVKYSFYSIVIYGLYRYAVPVSVKESVVDLSIKTVNYSKEFIDNKIMIKKL